MPTMVYEYSNYCEICKHSKNHKKHTDKCSRKRQKMREEENKKTRIELERRKQEINN